MTTPARRRWGRALALLLGAGAMAALGVAWLLRDPTPRFDTRRGVVAATEESAQTPSGAALMQDVTLRSTSGLTVHLSVRWPAPSPGGPSGERHPLFLILGGHERGRGAIALIPDSVGMIFASLDYPFDGDHRAQGLAALRQIPAIRRTLYDTPPSVALALDYLLTRPDVDTGRVELMGASFGVPFATIAAARDPRVTRLWLAHGGGDLRGLFEHGLRSDIEFAPARRAAAAALHLVASGPRFAPELWIAQLAPRPLIMLNAEDDEKVPRRSVDVLWEAAREPRELVWLPGAHMQGNRPDVLNSLLAAVLERVSPAPRAPH